MVAQERVLDADKAAFDRFKNWSCSVFDEQAAKNAQELRNGQSVLVAREAKLVAREAKLVEEEAANHKRRAEYVLDSLKQKGLAPSQSKRFRSSFEIDI